jgi:hypothetical protein
MPYKDRDRRLAKNRANNKRWYAANREAAIAAKAVRRERIRAELRKLVDQARDRPCMDCGGTFPVVCMDFDHVRGKKHKNVADMVSNCASVPVILAEIAKCDVVCSNCHRVRTYNRSRSAGSDSGSPLGSGPRSESSSLSPASGLNGAFV